MGELGERDITTVTNKGLKVSVVGNVPGLDVTESLSSEAVQYLLQWRGPERNRANP